MKITKSSYRLPGFLYELNASLYRNAFFILLVNLLPGAIGIIYWGSVSRLYPPADVGLGAAVISAFVLVSSISGMGINTAVVRFFNDSDNPTHFLNALFTLTLLTSIFLGLIFLMGVPFWSPGLYTLSSSLFYALVFIVSIVVSSISTLVVSVFISRHRSQLSLFFMIISNFSRLILVVVFVNAGAKGIVTSITLSYILALILIMTYFLPRVVKGYRLNWVWDKHLYGKVLPYSITNYLSIFAQHSVQTILPLMIVALMGPEANAYAYIPLMFTTVITSVGYSLSTSALAESVSRVSQSGNFLRSSVIVGLGISLFLTSVALFAAPFFLRIFGPNYLIESTALFRIAVLSGPLMVLNQNYFTKLRLEQRLIQLFFLSCLGVLLILMITYLLIPEIGIESCGIGLLFGNGLVSTWVVISYILNKRNI